MDNDNWHLPINSFISQTGKILEMKLQTKGEVFIRCEAHEGEVKVLWKGGSAAVESGKSLFTQYCCSKGRKHEAINFLSSAAFLIQPAKSVFPGVRICG